jgi:hypothetical protein
MPSGPLLYTAIQRCGKQILTNQIPEFVCKSRNYWYFTLQKVLYLDFMTFFHENIPANGIPKEAALASHIDWSGSRGQPTLLGAIGTKIPLPFVLNRIA